MQWLRRIWPRSLAIQMALLVMVSTSIPQLFYTYHMANDLVNNAEQVQKAQAQALTINVSVMASTSVIEGRLDQLEQLLMQSVQFPGVLSLQIVSPSGQALADVVSEPGRSSKLRFGRHFIPPSAHGGALIEYAEDGSILLLWQPINAGKPIGWVRTEYSLENARTAKQYFWMDSLIAGLLSLAFSCSLLLLYLRRLRRYLRLAGDFASHLDSRSGEQFVLPTRTHEFASLVSALNGVSTSLQQQSIELNASREEALSASQAKGSFLANMSHEIRTPLNAILGFAHISLMMDMPPRAHAHINKICCAAESLLGIINDTLDFSKIDAGKLEIESIPFDLDEELHRITDLFRLKARTKGLELVVGALPAIPNRLLGNPIRIGQVLINLVDNAIKFTEHGEISLVVSLDAISSEIVTLRFDIRDTGMGIAAEQQSKLFTAFNQVDSSMTRKHGGTGLGLAISKKLVELMHGELSVESEAGVGTC